MGCVLALPSNKRLAALAAPLAAGTWPHERQMVVKAEHTNIGANTRFVVTNLDMADDPQGLYDRMCCERGEMENRIKDQQLGLFATDLARASPRTIRLTLLKAGTVVLSNTRRVHLLTSRSHPASGSGKRPLGSPHRSRASVNMTNWIRPSKAG